MTPCLCGNVPHLLCGQVRLASLYRILEAQRQQEQLLLAGMQLTDAAGWSDTRNEHVVSADLVDVFHGAIANRFAFR